MDTLTGDGVEMIPFHNIFYRWYVAQSSNAVPFGHMKDPNDKEKWLIDESVAEIIRKLYALCIAGQGPSQIVWQLEEEQILIPSAYYESIAEHTLGR